MYNYNIKLNFKVESCSNCPFRREMMFIENVESIDKLTGVSSITRKTSNCMLREEPIFTNEFVEGYNSKCPLKGSVIFYDDKENK